MYQPPAHKKALKNARTAMVHALPVDFCLQLLKDTVLELWRQEIGDQVRVASPNDVAYTENRRFRHLLPWWGRFWGILSEVRHG